MSLRSEIAAVASDANLDIVGRSFAITALISEALAPLHVEPVIVGGMAVLFWTARGEFATHDIDLVMDEPPDADDVLVTLGFRQTPNGRHWQLPGTDVLVELPSRHLPDGAQITHVDLPDGRVVAYGRRRAARSCTTSSVRRRLMSTMRLNYTEWRAGDAHRHAVNEPFVRGMEQVSRTRPRSRDEAEFLRSIGTPERKIGPTRPDEAT